MSFLDISWLNLALIGFTVGYVLNLFLRRNFGHWKSLGIDGPKPLPLIGTLGPTIIRSVVDVEIEQYKKFGKVYGKFFGSVPSLNIANPEDIKKVLVKDFHIYRNRIEPPRPERIIEKILVFSRDDTWKRIRAISSPTFTSGKLKKMYSVIDRCLDDFLNYLDGHAAKKAEINLKESYGAYTMDVIASCAFGTKVSTHNDPSNPFITNANQFFFPPRWNLLLAFSPLPKFVKKYIFDLYTKFAGGPTVFFTNLIHHLIQERKKSTSRKGDFLDLLIEAVAEDGDDESAIHDQEEADKNRTEIQLSKHEAKKLTDEEIVAQSLLFFIDGYETTASTLTNCTYELAVNPEVQDQLYEEVAAIQQENGHVDYDVLLKLPLLDAVLSETLRKYPPLMILFREVGENTVLANVPLRKGDYIEIPVFALHRDPQYFPDPDAFKPERFLPENKHKIVPYTYLPFGAGPRNCLGMRFALLEAKLALAKLIFRYRFVKTANTDVPLQFLPSRGPPLLKAKRYVVQIEKR